MIRIAVISANLGGFDKVVEHVPQDTPSNISVSMFRFTDENFPPRICSMTPRLQARIPKMFGWEMAPGFDYYIWVDSSCALLHPNSVMWFHSQIFDSVRAGYDMALFRHPFRNTITDEANEIRKRLADGDRYITSRYKNELIDEQLAAIFSDRDFVDDTLYATTAFIYANRAVARLLLTIWWAHTSRYHSVDQLSLPYLLWKSYCTVNRIKDNLYKIPYLTHTRNHAWRAAHAQAL